MTGARENRIRREASRWVVKFDGPFDARDVRAFRRWLARSDDHRAAFQHASATWNQLDLLSRLEAYPLPANDARPLDRRVLLGGAGAAAAALGIGVYAFGAGTADAYETAVGQTREFILADGSRVLLNASSRLEARIGDDRRQARLLAGEVLFTIAEHAAGVFTIAIPAGEIEAMEGEILVKLVPEGARVALLSDEARASRRTWIGPAAAVTAGAHSEIVFGAAEMAVDASTAEQLARRILWREGMLAFDDTPLAEAAADVTRQSGVRFIFADPELASLRVGGLVRADDLDAFLVLLSNNLSITSERGNGEIVLRPAH